MAQNLPSSERGMDALRSALQVTGFAAQQYADEALTYTPIDIEVEDFKTESEVPAFIQRAFRHYKQPPQAITGVDIRLAYDSFGEQFSTNEVTLQLNTGHTVNYIRSAFIGKTLNGTGTLFMPTIINPANKVTVNAAAQPLRPDEIHDTLQNLGVFLPSENHTAAYDAIAGILMFAGVWRTRSSHTKLLDMRRRVRVEKRFDGKGTATDLTPIEMGIPKAVREANDEFGYEDALVNEIIDSATSANEVAVVHELLLDIEESRRDGYAPTSSLQFIQRSDRPGDALKVAGLWRTPLMYVGSDTQLLPPTRKERGNQKLVTPTVDTLNFIRGSLQLARGLRELTPKSIAE